MVSQPKREHDPAPITDAHWARLLRRARDVFGDRLTAVILTGERPASYGFRAASKLPRSSHDALTTALDIAQDLLELESRSTVQAWFVGMNPMLNDQAPALVIRTDPTAVRAAARHFAAYG